MIFFYLASFIPDGWGKIVALVIFVVAALTDMWTAKLQGGETLLLTLESFWTQLQTAFSNFRVAFSFV